MGNRYQTLQARLDYLGYYFVKQPVFPFNKFPGVDPILGPEMRSTGEVMGVAKDFGGAYRRGQHGVGKNIPQQGCAFISVRNEDKKHIVPIAQSLQGLGFSLVATGGTAQVLQQAGIQCELVHKITQGRPHIVDHIKNQKIHFILNTTEGKQADVDARHIRRSYSIRRSAIVHEIWYTTTLAGAEAALAALVSEDAGDVQSLQLRFASLPGKTIPEECL